MKHIFQIPSISIEQYQRMYNERRIYVLNLQREHRNFISRARYYSKNTSNDTKAPFVFFNKNTQGFDFVFELGQLNNNNLFINKISEKLLLNRYYTCFIKLRFSDDIQRMVGNQFGFSYETNQDIKDILEDIQQKIENFFEVYNSVDIDDKIVVYLRFNLLDKLYYNHLSVDESLYRNNEIGRKNLVSATKIPVTREASSFWERLETKVNSKGIITDISLTTTNKEKINFMDKILDKSRLLGNKHNDVLTEFTSEWEFFHLKGVKHNSILALNDTGDNLTEKYSFTLNGVLISHVYDYRLDNGYVKRVSGNDTFIIDTNNTIISSSKRIYLKKIEQSELSKRDKAPIFDPNLGAIDCETYKDETDGINKIYALGFRTNLDEKPCVFYIDEKTKNSDDIVIKLFDEILRTKYSDVKFLCHNFGNYDLIFMVKALLNYNEIYGTKYYLSYKYRDDSIISLTVKLRNDKNIISHSVTINDSYCLLNNSLSNLGKDFKVETLKSVFPHKFASKSTLFYKGETPDIKYYFDIDPEQYYKLYNHNWDFKEEALKYLNDDINCLYQIIVKATRQIWNDYRINMTDSLTISSLAAKLFTRDFYKNYIPIIDKKSMYQDIKQGYYGGITEVYKPYGENLYYYDVNSLYPYIAINNVFPGLSCTRELFGNDQSLDNLFGFYKANITTPSSCYLGILPKRTSTGLIFPLGTWTGWYFSEELKFAKEQGYKIKVIEGYSFNKVSNVFNDYVDKVFKFKMNAENSTQKIIAKSLLNNLLGRFGINLDQKVTELKSSKEFQKISTINKISSYIQIDEDNYLVSYNPKLDSEIIKSHNLDFTKIASINSDSELHHRAYSSITTSAAVTAYARIYMTKLKLNILKSGGNLYYSDTDSIVTDMKLEDSMVHDSELGKLKLEYNIKKGIFISGKTYGFITIDNKFVNKSKGIKSTSLSFSDYIKMLWNTNVEGIKTTSKKDWIKGDVDISESLVTLNYDAYKKRTKFYNKENIWYDTSPLAYNDDVNTSLIKFKVSSTHEPTKPKNSSSSKWWIKFLLFILFIVCSLFYIVLYSNESDENKDIKSDDSYIEIGETLDDVPLSVVEELTIDSKPNTVTKRLLDYDPSEEYSNDTLLDEPNISDQDTTSYELPISEKETSSDKETDSVHSLDNLDSSNKSMLDKPLTEGKPVKLDESDEDRTKMWEESKKRFEEVKAKTIEAQNRLRSRIEYSNKVRDELVRMLNERSNSGPSNNSNDNDDID